MRNDVIETRGLPVLAEPQQWRLQGEDGFPADIVNCPSSA